MGRWIFLSYELSDQLSGYGNGKRFHKEILRSMAAGDTSNNSELSLPAHTGTHIDFPFHFCKEGKTGSDYPAGDFIFSSVKCVEISKDWEQDTLIKPEDLSAFRDDASADLLILKTGFCNRRDEPAYWEANPGFDPGCAGLLKQKFPSLRAIIFDSISLSSWKHRDIGRIAHKAFLCEHEIWIIEDADLENISEQTRFNRVIISPLRFHEADGTPVTILAEINT